MFRLSPVGTVSTSRLLSVRALHSLSRIASVIMSMAFLYKQIGLTFTGRFKTFIQSIKKDKLEILHLINIFDAKTKKIFLRNI